MKNQEQETDLKLSKKQIQSVINDHIQQEHGLNDLFSMMVNGLMLSERKTFLTENDESKNKGNGYRYASKSGIGSKLQLKIPRDRMGLCSLRNRTRSLLIRERCLKALQKHQ